MGCDGCFLVALKLNLCFIVRVRGNARSWRIESINKSCITAAIIFNPALFIRLKKSTSLCSKASRSLIIPTFLYKVQIATKIIIYRVAIKYGSAVLKMLGFGMKFSKRVHLNCQKENLNIFKKLCEGVTSFMPKTTTKPLKLVLRVSDRGSFYDLGLEYTVLPQSQSNSSNWASTEFR